MELRDVWSALRTGWWLLAVGLVLGGSAALVVSLLQTPRYTSTTQFFVSTRDSSTTSDVFQGSQFSQQRVTSYAQLLDGEQLAGRVVDRLGLDLSPYELTEQITAAPVTDTVLLDVYVTDPSPQRAQAIAQALGDEFTRLVAELEAPDTGGGSPVKVTVTRAPSVPTEPSSPATARDVALGMLVGLALGAAIALLRVKLDRTVKGSEVATEETGAPVIGIVMVDAALAERHVIHGVGVANRTAEAYRQLRTNLQFLAVDEPPKVIMVSSAVPSEGKTTVVVNLAITLAEAGRHVTVVEADLRRPRVTRYLGLVGGVGVTNILTGVADLGDVIQTYGPSNMSVVAAGPTPPNPGELLVSENMSRLIEVLREKSDIVLIDAPPILPVADASGLATIVDGVLLSVHYGRTRKNQLRLAATTLAQVNARLLGVVLNLVPHRAEIASAYGYGLDYGSDPEPPARRRKHASETRTP